MPVTIADLVATARSRVRNLGPAQVEAHLFDPDTLLVDIREPEELDEHGLIAGAVHAPRGMLEFLADPASPLHRAPFDPARTTILYCAAGSRSALAADVLQQLGYGDVAHLDGGLTAWTQAGLPVVGLRPWHLHRTHDSTDDATMEVAR
jgi:rhodanese-related sulfurtransferase